MTTRLGRHQRAILAQLRRGAILTCDGGAWALDGRRVEASSCVALLQRGLIYEWGREGTRVRYGLAERGRTVE